MTVAEGDFFGVRIAGGVDSPNRRPRDCRPGDPVVDRLARNCHGALSALCQVRDARGLNISWDLLPELDRETLCLCLLLLLLRLVGRGGRLGFSVFFLGRSGALIKPAGPCGAKQLLAMGR